MYPTLADGLSDGPAMILSPRQDHNFTQFSSLPLFNHPRSSRLYPPSLSSLHGNGTTSNITTYNVSPSCPFAPSSEIGFTVSRKRSRGEAELDEATEEASIAFAPTSTLPVEEPVYGEGMILLNPRTGMALSAESQTGTWLEEAAESLIAAAPPVSSRSKSLLFCSSNAPGRKSQRLDTSAPGLDDIALSSIQKRLQSTIDDNRRSFNHVPGSCYSSPEDLPIDDATRLLGISWQQVANDGEMAAAVRGWTKFIDNQYSLHLQDSRILMKNRALNAFLVSARSRTANMSTSLYLFTEDLIQAQLVGSTWETALQNLRTTPITFEGVNILQAGDKSPLDPAESLCTLGNDLSGTGLPPLLQAITAPANSDIHAELNKVADLESGMEVDS